MEFRGRNTRPIDSMRPAEDRLGNDTDYTSYTFGGGRSVSANRSIWAFGETCHLPPLSVSAEIACPRCTLNALVRLSLPSVSHLSSMHLF